MLINTEDFRPKFQQVIDQTVNQISSIRTGKASVSLLDGVEVEAYGSKLKLNEVANISVSDATLITVKPWDKNVLAEIEKGIKAAELNLSPVVDQEIIRVPVPPLTQERREEMVKQLHQKSESSKVILRAVRNEVKKEIEQQKGQAGISEDDISSSIEELENIVKEYLILLDEVIDNKEKDLLSL
jgi:ribosome recycling factor